MHKGKKFVRPEKLHAESGPVVCSAESGGCVKMMAI